jgi:UDP-sugar pyrophosphorylase
VHLIKQEKVACLTDNEAHVALEAADAFAVQTKPHGHGDVHALLHSSGLAAQWQQQGFKWVCFFQDTNALVFRWVPGRPGLAGLPLAARDPLAHLAAGPVVLPAGFAVPGTS